MKKFLIYGAVIVGASILAGGTAGIIVALLGGLFTTLSMFNRLTAERESHIDSAEQIAELTSKLSKNNDLNKKYEAMINRLQNESLAHMGTISNLKNKLEEVQMLTQVAKELPEVEKPVKKTRTKKTK